MVNCLALLVVVITDVPLRLVASIFSSGVSEKKLTLPPVASRTCCACKVDEVSRMKMAERIVFMMRVFCKGLAGQMIF